MLEPEADAVGKGVLAPSDQHGEEEQVQLVDEARLEGRGGESRPADGEISDSCLLQLPTAAGSNRRSIRVLAVGTDSSPAE